MTAASAAEARAASPDRRDWGHVVGWGEDPEQQLGDLAGLLDLVEEQDWQERALCAQTDPEAFFPEKGGSTREAKRICLGCEVRSDCLEYALEGEERFGIWGGLSERERRKLKKSRALRDNAAAGGHPAAESDTAEGESRC